VLIDAAGALTEPILRIGFAISASGTAMTSRVKIVRQLSRKWASQADPCPRIGQVQKHGRFPHSRLRACRF
jgi:hypothetical protein